VRPKILLSFIVEKYLQQWFTIEKCLLTTIDKRAHTNLSEPFFLRTIKVQKLCRTQRMAAMVPKI
jgi:hypothetical protein